MIGAATDTKQFIEDYFKALNGQPKTVALIDRYVTSADLKQHILQAEAAFPEYRLHIDQMIVEGDAVAVRATLHATHKGTFAGIEPTGKDVTAGGMMFYTVRDSHIAEFHMQLDMMSLVNQLKG